MVTAFARHTVSDYKQWRKVYDSVAAFQRDGGVVGEAVYQAVDDPNDVTVTHDFATIEKARSFFANPELKEIMKKGGVVGSPTIWYASKA